MIKKRSIKRVIMAADIQMGNIAMKQSLPIGEYDQIDPFLLLHHFGPREQIGGERSIMDVGPHPHRGFETVTFIFEGEIHHRDSRYNDEVIKSGGVQWMTAARGMVHSEGPSKAFVENGGTLEIIQLWINLPSHLKMNQPEYFGLQKEQIPVVSENGFEIQVVSGEYKEHKGAIQTISNTDALIVHHKDEGHINLQIPPSKSILFYQLDGSCEVNGIHSGPNRMLVFNDDGDELEIKASDKGKFILLSSEPYNEKVTSHGPFVMNNQTEILQAMRDYQMGKMGVLI